MQRPSKVEGAGNNTPNANENNSYLLSVSSESAPRDFCAMSEITVSQLSTAEQFVVGVWRYWDAFAASAERMPALRLLGPAFA